VEKRSPQTETYYHSLATSLKHGLRSNVHDVLRASQDPREQNLLQEAFLLAQKRDGDGGSIHLTYDMWGNYHKIEMQGDEFVSTTTYQNPSFQQAIELYAQFVSDGIGGTRPLTDQQRIIAAGELLGKLQNAQDVNPVIHQRSVSPSR